MPTTKTRTALPEASPKTPEALRSAIRTNPPAVMNASEAAIYIGICERLLHTETHRPGSSLRASKIGKRRLVYRRAEIDRWLELKALAA